jgi:hypothetical protein
LNKAEKLAAVLRKVKAKKPLTPAEEKLIEASRPNEPPRWVPTMKAVGEAMGVTDKAVLKWAVVDTDGALEKKAEGFDLDAIRALRKRFNEQSEKTRLIPGDKIDGEPDVATLKARKIRLECDKLATQIDILRAKYALVEDVLAEVRTVIFAIKDKFRRLGPEMAYEVSGVSPAEAEDRLNEYVNKALLELSSSQYESLAEKLNQPQDIGEQEGRMPAARERTGRAKA